jgi:CheY-like chemotaxis protein
LSIVKQLVQMMDGEISVESTPGRGATFRFSVLLQEQAAQSATPALRIASLAGQSVLLVDDSPATRRVLEQHLRALGLSVTTAADAQEATRLLENRDAPYGLAVLDVQMPRVGGLDLARQIRAAMPHRAEMKLVMLNAIGVTAASADFARSTSRHG